MIPLTIIYIVIFLSVVSAGVSILWNHTIAEGEILQRIGNFLKAINPAIGKPLGACLFCQAFWQSVAWGGSLAIVYDWQYLAMIPLSFLFVKLFNSAIYGTE